MAADMLRIEIKAAAVQAALNRLRSNLPSEGDMTPVMKSLGRVLLTGTQLRFRAGKAPDDQQWKASLRAALHGGQTLRDSGGLLGSITYEAGNGSVAVGTNKVYAAIHQFGGSIKAKGAKSLAFRLAGGGFAQVRSVTMPARPFLGASDTDQAELLRVLQAHFNGNWAG
jgi:phage virion morphogenesis protein